MFTAHRELSIHACQSLKGNVQLPSRDFFPRDVLEGKSEKSRMLGRRMQDRKFSETLRVRVRDRETTKIRNKMREKREGHESCKQPRSLFCSSHKATFSPPAPESWAAAFFLVAVQPPRHRQIDGHGNLVVAPLLEVVRPGSQLAGSLEAGAASSATRDV